jgi:hypothetical protein
VGDPSSRRKRERGGGRREHGVGVFARVAGGGGGVSTGVGLAASVGGGAHQEM